MQWAGREKSSISRIIEAGRNEHTQVKWYCGNFLEQGEENITQKSQFESKNESVDERRNTKNVPHDSEEAS